MLGTAHGQAEAAVAVGMVKVGDATDRDGTHHIYKIEGAATLISMRH